MEGIRTCGQLLEDFPCRRLKLPNTKLPILQKAGDRRDIYNISSPFFHHNRQLLLGRVEERDSEDSSVVFFRWNSGFWSEDEQYAPLEHLQDPFCCKIKGELMLGGVEVSLGSKNETTYRTVFYRETAPGRFERFSTGPERMKDIRLLELANGTILVATRPQGGAAGRGKIGFTSIRSLDELNARTISSAEVFDDQFTPEEWGGTNQLHLLQNGKVGALSHIARFDSEGNRHYYSTCFLLDPETGAHSPMKMVAVRGNFEDGPSKREDLKDVVFSGGLIRQGNGVARLYCGVSDTEAHCISISDPFLEWEST
ncbi:MAG: DUF1861 family protein [Clostridiales bacterium]|nr:DUF1861 family protein [Clostridiales bacterium]